MLIESTNVSCPGEEGDTISMILIELHQVWSYMVISHGDTDNPAYKEVHFYQITNELQWSR